MYRAAMNSGTTSLQEPDLSLSAPRLASLAAPISAASSTHESAAKGLSDSVEGGVWAQPVRRHDAPTKASPQTSLALRRLNDLGDAGSTGCLESGGIVSVDERFMTRSRGAFASW